MDDHTEYLAQMCHTGGKQFASCSQASKCPVKNYQNELLSKYYYTSGTHLALPVSLLILRLPGVGALQYWPFMKVLMILTDLDQMEIKRNKLLRQSRGAMSCMQKKTLLRNFLRGLAPFATQVLRLQTRVCRAAGSLSVSWSLPCVRICSGAGDDDKRIPVG